tara:strand:+ start:207 stop:332 length:126 start_codon:yes stop_codon:yes gene_type:complete
MLLRKIPEAEKFSIKKKSEWMEILKISSKEFDSLKESYYFK